MSFKLRQFDVKSLNRFLAQCNKIIEQKLKNTLLVSKHHYTKHKPRNKEERSLFNRLGFWVNDHGTVMVSFENIKSVLHVMDEKENMSFAKTTPSTLSFMPRMIVTEPLGEGFKVKTIKPGRLKRSNQIAFSNFNAVHQSLFIPTPSYDRMSGAYLSTVFKLNLDLPLTHVLWKFIASYLTGETLKAVDIGFADSSKIKYIEYAEDWRLAIYPRMAILNHDMCIHLDENAQICLGPKDCFTIASRGMISIYSCATFNKLSDVKVSTGKGLVTGIHWNSQQKFFFYHMQALDAGYLSKTGTLKIVL